MSDQDQTKCFFVFFPPNKFLIGKKTILMDAADEFTTCTIDGLFVFSSVNVYKSINNSNAKLIKYRNFPGAPSNVCLKWCGMRTISFTSANTHFKLKWNIRISSHWANEVNWFNKIKGILIYIVLSQQLWLWQRAFQNI